MEIVRGRSVLKRTAVGRLQYYEKEEPSVVRRQVEDTERELSRYEQALEQAEKELEALYERALGEAGADSAAVFMGHRMLLKDEEYRNSVTRAITGERVNAAFAVETVGDELCRLFLEMEDEYLRARLKDEEYRNSVTRAITGERVNAAFAVETVGDELCRLFLEMEDEYLRARAAPGLPISGMCRIVSCGSWRKRKRAEDGAEGDRPFQSQ